MEARQSSKPSFFTRTSMPSYRRRLLHGRTANFNINERRVLVQLVEQYKSVVDSKRNDVSTVRNKENIWKHMTRLFNAKFPDQKPREIKSLQRLWKNMKSKAKAQNTEIETMVESEARSETWFETPRFPPDTTLEPEVSSETSRLLPKVKVEMDADNTSVLNGAEETDGQESWVSESTTGRPLSTESTEKSEAFDSFTKIAPKPRELPTLVHMGPGNHGSTDLCSTAHHSDTNSSKHTTVRELNIPQISSDRSDKIRNDTLSETSAMGGDYTNDMLKLNAGQEMQFEHDHFIMKNGYEEHVLMMKETEHEQKMKNLRFEREHKEEEHALRMELLKEERELVRMRKELLKRQLESYISTFNA